MLVKTRHLRDEALTWAASSIETLERDGIVVKPTAGGAQPAWTASVADLQAQGDSDVEAMTRLLLVQHQGDDFNIPDAAMVEPLCRVFLAELQRSVAPADFEEICRRNQARDHHNICHSHDFVDANVVMSSAFSVVTGLEVDTQDDAHRELWNAAWSRASIDLANEARHAPAPAANSQNPT